MYEVMIVCVCQLRHIENQMEAAVGSGVVITSLNTEKTHKHRGNTHTEPTFKMWK